MAVKPIPEGYPRVCPYLAVDGAAEAIDFYSKLFGATERVRMNGPDGKVGHAEIQIGDSIIMLADSNPDWGNKSPTAIGGTPVTLMIYVDDVDKTHAAALEAGAEEIMGLSDEFYGDRVCQIKDPWGHQWHVATHIEDVPPDEMEKRAAERMQSGS